MKIFRAVVAALLFASGSLFAEEIDAKSVTLEINRVREAGGLLPVIADDRLALAAADRIRDMEERGYWGHFGPDGSSPFEWVTLRGFRFAAAGENLARGFETAAVMVEAWMESRGHRATLMSPEYTSVGIAVIDGYTTGRAPGKSVVAIFAREQADVTLRTSVATD